MINPFIKITGCAKDEPIYINVNKISSMHDCEGKELHPSCNTVIHIYEHDAGYVCKETKEEIMTMIQKYYDDCMLADFASNPAIAFSSKESINKWVAVKNARIMLHQFHQETK